MKIAIGIEYDGGDFCGWQSQTDDSTVQDLLQDALSKIAQHPVVVHAAGRTDAGVHATLMPAHFTSDTRRQPSAWVRGGNAHLPPAIRLLWAKPVAADFHARHKAKRRYYQYVLCNRPESPALLKRHSGFCHAPLTLAAMRQAAETLIGEHDFSAFRAAACQASSPVRQLHSINIHHCGEYIVFEFCGNGFLHHMVRNIIGTLIEIGRGRQPPEWTSTLLAAGDRRLAAPTAKAAGLYFCGADYSAHFKLPTSRKGAPFITSFENSKSAKSV